MFLVLLNCVFFALFLPSAIHLDQGQDFQDTLGLHLVFQIGITVIGLGMVLGWRLFHKANTALRMLGFLLVIAMLGLLAWVLWWLWFAFILSQWASA